MYSLTFILTKMLYEEWAGLSFNFIHLRTLTFVVTYVSTCRRRPNLTVLKSTTDPNNALISAPKIAGYLQALFGFQLVSWM